MSTKKVLGRGLSAIIEDVEEAYKQDIEQAKDLVREIDIERITANPYQPRVTFNETALKELSESIKRHGLLQPIIVVAKDNDYMLLAGERRLRASKLAGFTKIKAIVADIESKNLRELALIENIQREDLNPIELAIAYKELIEEYQITQDGLSEIIHKSRTQITNTIRLLSLSEQTKKYLAEGVISQGHAKVLVGLEPKDEETVVNTILGQKLSVRETEALVKKLKNSEEPVGKKEKTTINVSEELEMVSVRLKELGFEAKPKSNTITIHFKNGESIHTFLERFQ
ncbi:ParB/RepB/Spo0J family partition protein [Sulfurospirillum deleyianum]|uniref:ParB-like partition protein n=1 Tax=Sulfurospirillum deleyianum (strain ATCC 51133 / DSM 6946 / 5175) TaxID=525898 RepID=D1AZS9_SULD5|nr:ParB/RepB/Spo0J family partition protein [Sulfurospirillum deleyianum]ACZ11546.1 parB-like partition protein [Sulfurospirillum deleyianum DSM 6946]